MNCSVGMEGDEARLHWNAAADCSFKQGFEWPESAVRSSCSSEQLLNCFTMAGELDCCLRAECGQAAENEYLFAALQSGQELQDGVVLRHGMLGTLVERRFPRLGIMVHDPGGVAAGNHGEVAARGKHTQGWVLRRRTDEDEVVQLGLVPGDEHAALQDEMRVMPVEELGEVIDTGELTDAGVGVDVVVRQTGAVRVGGRRVLQSVL